MDTGGGVRVHNIPQPYKVGYNAKSRHRKGSRHCHSKRSKEDREIPISHDITSRCNLKMDTNEHLSKRDTASKT